MRDALSMEYYTLCRLVVEAGYGLDEVKACAAALDKEHKRGKGYNKKMCSTCGAEGHFAKTCGRKPKVRGCTTCGQTGHYAKSCGKKQRVHICSICGKKWHSAANCPTAKPNNHEVLSIEWLPTPEMRPTVPVSGYFALNLAAATAASRVMSGSIIFEEA